MPRTSKYVLWTNVSSVTPTRDIDREFQHCGKVRDVVKDNTLRCALVEFYSSKDCAYAWKKMDGFTMDSRKWKVDYATKSDFKVFGWKWFESPSPPPRKDERYRSRSRSRSASRSPTPIRSGPSHRSD